MDGCLLFHAKTIKLIELKLHIPTITIYIPQEEFRSVLCSLIYILPNNAYRMHFIFGTRDRSRNKYFCFPEFGSINILNQKHELSFLFVCS